ncbi:MAG: GGDEF domain-containing protein, partial [Pseudonocardiales bacterium]|nr:GGDEF domain-containing protein [Pseudonocardiales bacterium]
MSSTAQPASRAELASAWSHALSSTADVPLWPEIIEECLRDQADRLLDAFHQEPFCPEPVEQAAAALVARGIADDQSLARTV